MKMSDLPWELVDEILCRVPVTCLGRIRSTCKNWNSLSEDTRFRKKQISQAQARARSGDVLAIVLLNYKVSLMKLKLHGIQHNNSPPSINHISQLDFPYVYDISRVSRCDGLVLCTSDDYWNLVVWNPYTGQNLWICVPYRPSDYFSPKEYVHALGYEEKGKKSHKILRFANSDGRFVHQLYELNSNSWRDLDVTPDWETKSESEHHHHQGMSLKGNTYWYATDREDERTDFLVCFDFTAEKFGPRLPLPFGYNRDVVLLSSVREEQLAVLFGSDFSLEVEVWVTTKIEPNGVSWSKFLAADNVYVDDIYLTGGSLLIDEESKAVVVFGKDYPENNNVAHFIAKNGRYKKLELSKKPPHVKNFPGAAACSYVPSLASINQP